MKQKVTALHSAACIYEIIKLFYSASFSSVLPHDLLFFKYISLAALCIPVIPWFMLALNEAVFYRWLYTVCLFKLLFVCAEFLYIFHEGFAIIGNTLESLAEQGSFTKGAFFFLAVDTVLLFYSYIRGSMYYANHTDC